MELIPIGVIRTGFQTLEGMPIQNAGARNSTGRVVLDPAYEEGLADIDGFSHVILLYHFHQSSGFDLVVKPFMDTRPRGLFSTRAPRRPCAIGFTVVELVSRKGRELEISGIDVLDRTPLLDIKPYVPKFDAVGSARIGWMESNQDKADTFRSDGRFVT